jgi:hypothetical protein
MLLLSAITIHWTDAIKRAAQQDCGSPERKSRIRYPLSMFDHD